MKRREDANNAQQCLAEVSYRQPQSHRSLAFLARDVHDSAQRLNGGVECFRWSRARVASKPADRAVDDSGVDLPYGFVADAQTLQDAGAEVLHDHICFSRQVCEHLPTLFVLQIERHP